MCRANLFAMVPLIFVPFNEGTSSTLKASVVSFFLSLPDILQEFAAYAVSVVLCSRTKAT